MTPNRNRSREREQDLDTWMGDYGDEIPDPPENPEFLFLDPELQTVIAERFEKGIALREAKDRHAREGLIKAGVDARKRWHDREARKAHNLGTLGDALPALGEEYRKRRTHRGTSAKERS